MSPFPMQVPTFQALKVKWRGFGAHGARETPVTIPNTEVKPCSGYYTAIFRGKIARCRIFASSLLLREALCFMREGDSFSHRAALSDEPPAPAALIPKRHHFSPE